MENKMDETGNENEDENDSENEDENEHEAPDKNENKHEDLEESPTNNNNETDPETMLDTTEKQYGARTRTNMQARKRKSDPPPKLCIHMAIKSKECTQTKMQECT